MAERREDILVRIRADYAKALADMQRFTGSAAQAFDQLPKAVQSVAGSVDRLTERIDRMGRSDGPDQLRRRLGQTDQEATRLSKTFDKLLLSGKGIGVAMAAWQAGKMVLAPVVNNTMDYGMRLAQATNITALGASNDEKFKVMHEIDSRLQGARRAGGGKREDLLTGYELLTARNAIGDKEQTLAVMPGIAKTATAGNASVEDIAKTTAGLIKSLGVATKDNELALAQLLYAGQIGGFELKNMAHWIPVQSASAKNAGYSGLPAVAKMAALNELAIDYAGTPDQAGTNVGDFLNSMNSAHLANNLKRFSFDKKNNALVYAGSRTKGKNHLDLGHLLAANAERGIDSIDTLIQITGMVTKGDPKYAEAVKKRDAAKQRLESAKKRGDSTGQVAAQQELTTVTESVVQILEGRGIGKLFHNQQEMRGAIGVLTNADAYHAMVSDTQNKGTLKNRDNALQWIQVQPGYKAEMYAQNKDNAQYGGMEGFNGWLGKMADGASALYEKFPVLASALEDGKVAVGTMGAAAGTAAIALALLTKSATAAAGGGVNGPRGGPAGGAGGAGGAGAGGGAGSGLPGIVKRLTTNLKVAGPINAALAGIEAYGISKDGNLTEQQKKIGYTGAAGGAIGGTLGGAVAGAAAGSFLPGIGTLIGGLIGAAIGNWAGRGAGTMVGEAMFGDDKKPLHKKFMDDLHEKSALNPLEARLQMHTTFNSMAQPIALPPIISAELNKPVPKPLAQPIALPPIATAEPGKALQMQMSNQGVNSDAVQRALIAGLKPLPVDVGVKVTVVNEAGKPYPAQSSVSGKNVRLDTGPMMTH